jgi:hypothetical protein
MAAAYTEAEAEFNSAFVRHDAVSKALSSARYNYEITKNAFIVACGTITAEQHEEGLRDLRKMEDRINELAMKAENAKKEFDEAFNNFIDEQH